MASYTKEEFAQIMAQFEDSGQRITKITKEGICITAAVRKDIQQNRPLTDTMDEIAYNELKYENKKLKKRAQEAEGELSILRGIETNRVKEAQARSNQLQDELDRVKKDNNDLFKRIAELTK